MDLYHSHLMIINYSFMTKLLTTKWQASPSEVDDDDDNDDDENIKWKFS